mmetsp:Transcript_23833/g.40564  ORF Transcript_23833/g.40564 Transcript_23833/m.40564 type:complete len:211 (+) Transcript_23833:84-716(+)
MPPHGPGMIGATHSHDPEYPDDMWNLYTQLEPETTTALNATQPSDALGIFKPNAVRLDPNPTLFSDADEEMLVVANFVSPVHIRKIWILGGGDANKEQHPSELKLYVNKEGLDFTQINDHTPTQVFQIPMDSDGLELTTLVHSFTQVTTLHFFFSQNHGADTTAIQYIGMQGEHTHYRREAVHAQYEVQCTGEDKIQPLNPLAGMSDLGH